MKCADEPCASHNLSDDGYGKYYVTGPCDTCWRWQEIRCVKCGLYITSCPCGSCDEAHKQSIAQRKAAKRKSR